MIPFIVIACLMLLIALAFVLVPLLRIRANAAAVDSVRLSDAVSNVAVFRSQKREIEEDFSRGVIGAEERDAALNELSQRLVDEVPGDAAGAPAPIATQRPHRPWLLMGVLGALIPLAALLLYATLGTPQALRGEGAVEKSPHAAAGAAPGTEPPISDKQIVAMVDTLAQKMQQNPGDPKGWVLLARSQAALGRYPEAVNAYEQAAKLLPADAQLLADYADVVVMAQDGRFEGKPLALIKQVLKLDPDNKKGLALAGTAELRLGNRAASLKHWEKLKTLVAKDSDDSRQVEAIIAEVQSGKTPVEPAAGNAVAATAAVPARPGDNAKPAAPAMSAAPAVNAGVSVSGQV
ncbi:MAG: c-type cytochrome biogenesis protein CcmI, partial [Betaproteobacteria bacterium]